MGPAGFLAGTQLRRRWGVVVALAVFVGVIGGLAIALVAGSKRSASVVERYFAAGIPYDFGVFVPSLTREDLLDLPGVVRADPTAYVAMVRVGAAGVPAGGVNGMAVDWSSVDPTIRVLSGAVPDGTDPFEVVVNEAFVEVHDRGVGDVVEVQMFGVDQLEAVQAGDYRPTGPRYTFRVAAVVRMPIDLGADEVQSIGESAIASTSGMAVSYDFYEHHRGEFLDFEAGYDVQLVNTGDARDDFVGALEQRADELGDIAIVEAPRFQDRRPSIESPVELETDALLLLGVGIGLAGLVTIALLLRAERRSHEHDEPTLRAAGYTAHQLGLAAMLRTAPAAVGGAGAAMFLAVAVSSRFPVGIGRQVELVSGIELNSAVVGVGGVSSMLAVSLFSYLLGRAAPQRDRAPRTGPGVAGRLARLGAPTELVIGADFALASGRGSRPRAMRAGLVGGAAALAIIVTVGTYVAGVDRLYSDPTARGWAWDAVVGNVNFALSEATIDELAGDPRIEATTVARSCWATIEDESVEVLAVRRAGTAPPVIVTGRLPASASEIALGARVARRLDARIGDLVRFSIAGADCETDLVSKVIELTVVGTAVPPVFAESDIGQGAIVTVDAIAAAGGNDEPQFMMMTFVGDDTVAVGASLDREVTEEILTDSIPAEVANLHRVRELPLIGLLIAGALGAIIIIGTLTVGRRARTRDLAVLRALGLTSRQLWRIAVSEGALVAVAMAVVGIPIGFLVGRAVWQTSADGLGVTAGPIPAWLMLVAPLCGAVAVTAALQSARRARRPSVATLLHVD